MLGSLIGVLGGWQTKLIIAAIMLVSLFAYHKVQVSKAVTKAVAEIELNLAKENFKLRERALNAQIGLQESFDNIQKDQDAKIKTLNARVASLTRSLSERPSRPEPSGVSESTGTQEIRQGSTGVGLYREDGVFLAREAARADEIRIELQSCYKSYDAAKEVLDKYKKESTAKTD